MLKLQVNEDKTGGIALAKLEAFKKRRAKFTPMNWWKNYRWLKSQKHHNYPKIDHAKRAATKAELLLVSKLQALENVVDVHHAVRLNSIHGDRSRREVDVMVLMNDRLVLIEIKNFKGKISMDENGELVQAGRTRHWSFEKLDDAKLRFGNLLRQTGIDIGQRTTHCVLFFSGSAEVDDSVSVGHRMSEACVAKNFDDLKSYLKQPLPQETPFSKAVLEAMKSFFQRCGTWDSITFNNGAVLEGDVVDQEFEKIIRKQFRTGKIENLRGPWSTVFKGPNLTIFGQDWNGNQVTQAIAPDQCLEMVHPGKGGKPIPYRFDHVNRFEFGYASLTDWSTVSFYEKKANKPAQSRAKSSSKAHRAASKSDPQFSVGQVVLNAVVSKIDERFGVFFTLGPKQDGLYFKEGMELNEWTFRDINYGVGSRHDVVVVKIKSKGNGRWNITVKPVDRS